MKIFVDFDETLFNTRKFIIDLNKIYFKHKIYEIKINEYAKKLSNAPTNKNLPYKPERLVAFAKKGNRKIQNEILAELDIFLKNLKKYVFADTPIFLRSINKKELFLISYGDVKFQKNKIFGSGLGNHFHRIFTNTQNKIVFIIKIAKKEKFSKKEKIFLIDDKLENLVKAEKIKKEIITIWMNRFKKQCPRPIAKKINYEVKNLKEALKIILSIG